MSAEIVARLVDTVALVGIILAGGACLGHALDRLQLHRRQLAASRRRRTGR